MPSLSPVETIFFGALEKKTPEERDAYLAEACADAPDLRARVERLLAGHGNAGSFLEHPAVDLGPTIDRPPNADSDQEDERVGASIGPYKLLEKIGEGGMGVVYMADQQTPVRRRVALKVIKPGMDSRQITARFEAERQALAMMDHPNIARVLDANTTDAGLPYFVMELVRGVPITDYCDQNNLPVHERLDLLIQVCHAVQHAHQKGIIHRDIKPSNVLVTLHDGRAVPKVIDFGVAKALNQQLTEKTLFTNFAQMIGTPLYMSPEQAAISGLDVDTRADVYSLGVLMYELLTGTTPFDKQRLRGAAFDEIRRIIREEEPVRPSTRLSTAGERRTTIAAQRRADPNRLSDLVRGDLDWIVMKSLEKDRTRRYETVDGLARDIGRYLSDEPVEACPPSVSYRFRKFARRNRGKLVTAGLLLATLFLGVAGSAWQAVRATWAERAAEAALVAEAEQRKQADVARQQADSEAKTAIEQKELAKREQARAERLVYGSEMRLANMFWEQNETWDTWESLEECPLELRGWEHDYLYTQLTLDHQTFELAASDVKFSLDGRSILVESGEEVFLIDAVSGSRLKTIARDDGDYACMDSSLDGRRLAIGSTSGEISIWDLDTDQQILKFKAYEKPVECVAFSPDGTRLVSAVNRAGDNHDATSLTIWDTADGKRLHTLKGHSAAIADVSYSPDGSKIVSGAWDKTARVWEASSGTALHVLEGHEGFVGSVTFSPDGQRIATAAYGGAARLWDAKSGDLLSKLDVDGSFPWAAFSPEGSHVAVTDRTRIAVFDVISAKRLYDLRGHFDLVYRFVYSRDGKQLVSCGSGDERVMVWDMERHQQRRRLEQTPTEQAGEVIFSPDGRSLITNMDNQATIWDMESRRKRISLPPTAIAIAISPDGRRLATGHFDGNLALWDINSGKELYSAHVDDQYSVSELAFTPDGSALISGSRNVEVRKGVDGQLLRVLGTGSLSSGFAFLDLGRAVIVNQHGGDGIQAWNVDNGSERLIASLGDETVHSVAVRPDGKLFATGFTGGQILLWQSESGVKVRALKGHTDIVQSLAFSPDGRRLASGSNDKTIRLWDAEAGGEVLTLKTHGPVHCVAFSPDGRTIASASNGVGVELWQTPHKMPASK